MGYSEGQAPAQLHFPKDQPQRAPEGGTGVAGNSWFGARLCDLGQITSLWIWSLHSEWLG